MGWLTMPRSSMDGHATPKAYLDAQFTYERRQPDGARRALRVLASACCHNRVYYAAVEESRDGVAGDVFAIVCLIRWNPRDRDGHVFGYKDMDETMGPCEAGCPGTILDLLTPTEHRHALEWRERCRASLARRARRLEHGDRIRFPAPISFTDGHVGDEFVVERQGRRIALRDPASRRGYRVSRLMECDWTIVPETRIHATLFA